MSIMLNRKNCRRHIMKIKSVKCFIKQDTNVMWNVTFGGYIKNPASSLIYDHMYKGIWISIQLNLFDRLESEIFWSCCVEN